MLVRGNIFGVTSVGEIITADDVTETATRVFVSPQQKADLDDLIVNAENIAGQVNTFADLPDVAASVGLKYTVLTGTGVWGVNRKPAGTYLSTGTVWTSKYNSVDVINSLASTQTQKALSAAQGKILNDSKLNTVGQGAGITIDYTDPLAPVINSNSVGAFPPNYLETSNIPEESNGTATPQVKVSHTIPASFPTGSYLVHSQMIWRISNTGRVILIDLFKDGAIVDEVNIFESVDTIERMLYSRMYRIDHVNGTDSVLEQRFYRGVQNVNVFSKQAFIRSWRVA